MGSLTDTDLYDRSIATLLAAWTQFAAGSAGARVDRLAGVAAAVFPAEPERAVYNNAVLDRHLGAGERAAAIDAMEAAYAAADVAPFAAWVHETDFSLQED